MANAYLALVSPVADTGVAHFLDTASAYTSGKLQSWRANAVEKASVDFEGSFTGKNADLAGDLDVDGTTNLDVVDIDGAVDMASTLTLGSTLTVNAGAVFNEASADVDFRVESDDQANMFFVDGGADRVGIKTGTPSALLDIGGATNTYAMDAIILDGGNGGLSITDNTKYLGFWATHGGSSHAGSTLGTRSNHDLAIMTNDTKRMILDTSGQVLINDIANANMTVGLTINQGASDDQIFALKSSDISTGLTSVTSQNVEVDDWFTISKTNATQGGARIQSLNEDDSAGLTLDITAIGGTAETADTTGSDGLVSIFALEHDGSNAMINSPANSNIFAVKGRASGAFITHLLLKGDDGELHIGNTTLVALDDEDDISLVRAMQYEASGGVGMRPKPWTTEDYGVPTFSHEKLMEIGVLGEKDENGRCLMRVQPRFAMNEGAIWQNHIRHMELVNCLHSLVESNPTLQGRDEALALLEI